MVPGSVKSHAAAKRAAGWPFAVAADLSPNEVVSPPHNDENRAEPGGIGNQQAGDEMELSRTKRPPGPRGKDSAPPNR